MAWWIACCCIAWCWSTCICTSGGRCGICSRSCCCCTCCCRSICCSSDSLCSDCSFCICVCSSFCCCCTCFWAISRCCCSPCRLACCWACSASRSLRSASFLSISFFSNSFCCSRCCCSLCCLSSCSWCFSAAGLSSCFPWAMGQFDPRGQTPNSQNLHMAGFPPASAPGFPPASVPVLGLVVAVVVVVAVVAVDARAEAAVIVVTVVFVRVVVVTPIPRPVLAGPDSLPRGAISPSFFLTSLAGTCTSVPSTETRILSLRASTTLPG
mmetsp:Transcript_33388/g.104068  ORF Transcript_33388/g.104068 Transcript_33388/m.104068 type:complete len:268 (+) Transcript_33388:318-1121(+)